MKTKRWLAACVVTATFGGSSMVGACSSSSSSTPAGDGGTGEAAQGDDGSTVATFDLEVPCTDTADAVYGDPGAVSASDAKGKILKCAKGNDISKSDLQAAATADGYVGRPFTSGAHVYRVLYRTERGTDPGTVGYSSAIVYVPDAPRSGTLPVIVASHGTAGQAGACTPSKKDPADSDVRLQAYPLVGSGYAVIAPDLAGYANFGAANDPPSGYAGAADVGKSTLDGTRALKTMFSKSLGDKVVILGHSQGGHTALSALALSDSYGSAGTVVGVVAYAPLWLSQRSWGALFFLANQYTIKDQPLVNAVSVWYHYTNGELMNPGHGVDLFKPEKQQGIKDFVSQVCEKGSFPELEALGTTAKDLYTQEFQDAITLPAAAGTQCGSDPLCATWMARYAADRPHLTGNAAKVPILINYGGKDTTIPKDRMACVFERLKADNANYSVCYQDDVDHSGIVEQKSDYVNDWIANVAMGAPAPAACAQNESNIQVDGGPVACATPPPND